jgi:two-component system heavy metal sensor histidine kinase CusS
MSSKTARKPSRPWSLAARLTAWYAGSAFLLLLGATGFLYWALIANLDREDDQILADKVHLLRTLLRDRPEDTQSLKREIEEEWAARQAGTIYVRILDEAGGLVLETPGMAGALGGQPFPEAGLAEGSPPAGTEVWTPAGRSFRVVAARATLGPVGGPTRIIQLAIDRTYEEALLAGYRRDLWLVLALALVVCAALGYHLARRGLRPLAEITATTRRIRSTTLSERLADRGLPAELHELAATFNEMLDRLEESFARLARFSADIAHELRTPVNNLRGEAEVALSRPRSPEEYRDVLGSCLEECGRLTRLIDSLLFLARAEVPQTQIAAEPVDVARELDVVREFYAGAAAEAGVTLTVADSTAGKADLDRTLFQRALSNLVANALAHTPAGGTVTLTAAADGAMTRVEVADTGHGIPPEHVAHVFDRFYRVDPSRASSSGGVGLGLAIVKSIVGLHGGRAELTSQPRRGTLVRLYFPSTHAARPQPPAGNGT